MGERRPSKARAREHAEVDALDIPDHIKTVLHQRIDTHGTRYLPDDIQARIAVIGQPTAAPATRDAA